MARGPSASPGRLGSRGLAFGAAVLRLALCTSCDDPDRNAVPDDSPPGVPDLQVEPISLDDVGVTDTLIGPDDCELQEACVGAAGSRRLLRFETVTSNRGTADLVIGRPPATGISDDTFVWSQCHQHHHVPGYTLYELVNTAGDVTTSRKQSFCLQDDQNFEVGRPRRYNCQDQGLSRGWADVYGLDTPCQWIDVTDLPSGEYTLRITVNPQHGFVESSYDNNEFSLRVPL